MKSIDLPHGRTLYCCEVCGLTDPDRKKMLGHEADNRKVQEAIVQAGDIITLDDAAFQTDIHDPSMTSSRWMVRELYYTQEQGPPFLGAPASEPHDLMVSLEALDGNGKATIHHWLVAKFRMPDRTPALVQ